MIAELFRESLKARYYGVFERVVFAVLDFTSDESTLREFRNRFLK